ncbi:MAG: hypothetical protein U5N26_09085 [Candidatus Marinimicrobia bacterium]|nr:hypothetical protein [Candidatus Neomarinimicrobiota bacterium]
MIDRRQPLESSAWIRSASLDNSQYHADENIAVTVEVREYGTSSMDVMVETNLLNLERRKYCRHFKYANVYPAQRMIRYTEVLYIPYGSAPGTYTVQVLVYDAGTYIQQDMELIEMEAVDLTAGISVEPASLSEELQTGTMSTRILTISNTGSSDLSWETVPVTALYLSEYVPFTVTPEAATDDSCRQPRRRKNRQRSASRSSANAFMSTRDASLSGLNTLLREEHSSIFHYDNALNALGMGRTLVTTWDHFHTELTNGTPWDLVIVNSYSNTPGSNTLDQLSSYVNGGGLLIFADWCLYNYRTHSLIGGDERFLGEQSLHPCSNSIPPLPQHPFSIFPNSDTGFCRHG